MPDTIFRELKMKKDSPFRMPKRVNVKARSSSITNAFFNGIIPCIEPKDEEVDEALKVLGMTEDTICCAYCGDKMSEWEHFHPLVVDKKPTGYITEIHNLVPSCNKCNSSKGNKEWKKWMYSKAKHSPKSRGIADMEQRVKRLEDYEKRFAAKTYDLEALVGEELWKEHLKNLDDIINMMNEAQLTSDEIQEILKNKIH